MLNQKYSTSGNISRFAAAISILAILCLGLGSSEANALTYPAMPGMPQIPVTSGVVTGTGTIAGSVMPDPAGSKLVKAFFSMPKYPDDKVTIIYMLVHNPSQVYEKKVPISEFPAYEANSTNLSVAPLNKTARMPVSVFCHPAVIGVGFNLSKEPIQQIAVSSTIGGLTQTQYPVQYIIKIQQFLTTEIPQRCYSSGGGGVGSKG